MRILPTRAHRHVIHGLALAADIISDIAWTAVRLSYYNTVANAYSTINENNTVSVTLFTKMIRSQYRWASQ